MSDAPELSDILERITDMPALPSVLASLTRLIADPRTTASDINAVLSSDPGLVTKILKLVNSPYYGFSRKITTITNAVVILGFNQVRNLALSSFIFDSFACLRDKASPFDISGFWRHSIGTAFLAACFAREIDSRLEEDAFICGLVHDLGKFIMAQNAPEHIRMVMDTVRKEDILFYDAEKICLHYTHAELGGVVMERWNLPRILVDVVKKHHHPHDVPEESQVLCCLTNAADIIARALMMGDPGDNRIPQLLPGVWDVTKLDWESLEDIMHKVAEDYSKSDAFFAME